MHAWVVLVASVIGFGFAAAGGCSSTETNSLGPTLATVTVGSGGVNAACSGGSPDGVCTNLSGVPESCDCDDCAQTAACTARCKDDGTCDLSPDSPDREDCTCADCYGRVESCPPGSVGCNNDDSMCTADEDCTCRDCTGTPRCTDHCDDNGSCVKYLEGCSCADCRNTMACGGEGPATTTTSTTTSVTTTTAAGGGMGGAGGDPGNGAGGAEASGGAGGA